MLHRHDFPLEARPGVEVRVGGEWWPGELRRSVHRGDGVSFEVAWCGADDIWRQGTFRADQVRSPLDR